MEPHNMKNKRKRTELRGSSTSLLEDDHQEQKQIKRMRGKWINQKMGSEHIFQKDAWPPASEKGLGSRRQRMWRPILQ